MMMVPEINMRWRWCVGVLVLAGASAWAGTSAVSGVGAWTGKVHEYANPFDPNLDRNASESTITSTAGWGAGAPLENIVNRVDGMNSVNGGGRLQLGGGGGTAVWMDVLAPAPFTAGTVISSQNVWSGFSVTMPYTLKLASGASPAWAGISPLFTGPGTVGYETLQIANPGGVCDHVRIDITATPYSGTGYADYNDLIVLPDALRRVADVTASSMPAATWGSTASLVDLTNSSGWANQGSTSSQTITFSLPEFQRVDALVLYSYDNRSAAFTIRDSFGNAVANVTMTTGPYGWSLPIQFDQPLYTDRLVFDWGAVSDVNFREVMILQIIPEPATGALLALAGPLLCRRRRA